MEELRSAGAFFLSETIKSLAKDMGSLILEKIKGYYTDTANIESIESGWAFEKYLNKVHAEYSKSKSFLYRHKARDLKAFFVPVDLKYGSEEDGIEGEIFKRFKPIKIGSEADHRRIPGKELEGLLKEGNRIIVTGVGGIGKTMHMKYFCINAIERGFKIPIFIPLRWFNDQNIEKETFEKLIYDNLCDFGFELEYDYFKYSLESDRYVFLLDGFDEIYIDKQHILTRSIQRFARRYSGNSFIISSRQIDKIEGWNEFKVLSLCRMTREQAKELIWKLDFPYVTKKRFTDLIDDKVFEKYESFISIPLLLSILFFTYEDNTMLPETLQEFYKRALDTMLYQHDNDKEGLIRKLESRLTYEEFKEIFYNFCFRTYFKDTYSFTETSLINNISASLKKTNKSVDEHAYKRDLVDISCMLIRDALEYIFIHRSFQEFFAAHYVSQLPDEMQRQFCIRFIAACDEKMVTIKENAFAFHRDEKVLDFMKMLCSIESKRFDSIVLLPILEKVHNMYLACGEDLITTTFAIFVVRESYQFLSKETIYKSGFRYCEGDTDNRLNAGEFLILGHYFSMWEEYSELTRSKELKDFIENNMGILSDGLLISERSPIFSQSFYGSRSLEEAITGTVLLTKTLLLKYDNMSAIDQNKIVFEDMLDRF